jgi:integrase
VSAHKLRHTAASLALASGVNPLAVSKLLNHSNLKTTEQYLHLMPDALTEARAKQRAGLKQYLA